MIAINYLDLKPMSVDQQIIQNIFSENLDFSVTALELFRFQYENNTVYKSYVDAINVNPYGVKALDQIPFLPIRFFKTHKVVTTEFAPEMIFESSGTTETINSRHDVKDLNLYEKSFFNSFQKFYGNIKDWCILGLLPSYLERQHSSLVYMVEMLIKESNHPLSGFYLNEFDALWGTLKTLEANKQKTLLIGVTFALIDFVETHPLPLQHTAIMETGGMKGRKKEMIKQEVHDVLKRAFNLKSIHSEYGMTELLSQAYSKGNGIFEAPPWMKILLRDDEDPLTMSTINKGIINVIDLANIYSCSFIATDDLGILHPDGSFEVTGRRDNSDLRGCSLLAL